MVTRNFSNQNRPFHLGNWPLEKLPRSQETADPDILNCDLDTTDDADLNIMRSILNEYQSLFSTHLTGETAVAGQPDCQPQAAGRIDPTGPTKPQPEPDHQSGSLEKSG